MSLSVMLWLSLATHAGFHADGRQTYLDGSSASGAIHYAGSATLVGRYEMFEDGDLCFTPRKRDLKLIPMSDARTRICFTEQTQALLGVADATKRIDTEHVCGFIGDATVSIADLWTGVDDGATRWHTAALTRVIKRSPYRFVGCK
jgi:hypothetical protein